jgi:hypothetical protein
MPNNEYTDILEGRSAEPANPYVDILQRDETARDAQFRASATQAIDANPEQVSTRLRVAKYLGVPPPAVDALPADAERAAKLKQLDETTASAPVTRQAFTDADFAKLAHDDANNLSLIEQATGALKRGWRGLQQSLSATGMRANANGLAELDKTERLLAAGAKPGSIAMADDVFGAQWMTPEQRTTLRDALGATAGQQAGNIAKLEVEKRAIPQDLVVSAALQSKSFAEFWQNFKEKPLSFITSVGLESLPQSLPGMVAAVPAGMAAGPVGVAAAMGGGSFATDYASSVLEAMQSEGVDIAKPDAITAAVKDNALMQRVGRRAFAHAAVVGAVDAVSGAMAGKSLAPARLATKPLSREAANIALQAPVQGALGAAGEAGGELAAGQDLDAGSIAAEFFGEFIGTPGEVVSAAGARVHERARAAAQAEHAAQALQQMSDLAQASKVRQRDVSTFENFVRQANEDGPVSDVYISASTLAQSGVDVNALAEVSPSVAEQFNEAHATGGDIRIPVEEFAGRIAGTDLAQSLIPHLRTEPGGMSQVEAQTFMQSHADELHAEVERALAAKQGDDTFKASRDAVSAQMLEQLNAAGRFTPDVNRTYADMLGNFYAVQGAKVGLTPEQMAERYPLQVRAERLVGAKTLDQEFRVTESETWDDGTVIDFGESPFPMVDRKKVDRPIGRDKPTEATVSIADLHASQPRITRQGLEKPRDDSHGLPIVVHSNGLLYIQDGHHRLSAQKYAGDTTARVRLIDLDAKAGRMPYAPSDSPNQSTRTIEVDGVRRPITNSEGGLLGREFGEQLSFWRWYGAGAADENGHPVARGGNYVNAEGETRPVQRYNQDATAGARGSITLGDDITQTPSVITLLQRADLSTFLHESGHFYLEVLADMAAREDAPQGVKDDMAAVLKWFGVPDLATWNGYDIEQKREHHEQFARGFEAYLFEGKAPSVELASMFQRFRAWLLNVYRSLSQLNVTLNDEVRGVFDRMLASTQAIQEAEAVRGYGGLFATKPEFMSDDEWLRYQSLGQDATQSAIHDLESRSLRDMQWLSNAKTRKIKELQREAEAKRKAVRAEVEAEVTAEPVNKARSYIAELRKRPDPFPEHTAAMVAWREQRDAQPKDQRAAWVEANPAPVRPRTEQQQWADNRDAFRAQTLADLKAKLLADNPDATGLKKGQLLAKNKRAMELEADRLTLEWEQSNPRPKLDALPEVHPDVLAEMFGFTSGDHLEKAMKAEPSAKEKIDALTDQRMLERYGDLTDEQAIARAADEALHDEARTRFVAAELAALEKAMDAREDTGRTNVSGRRITVATLPRAAKQFAEATIARLKVRDIRPAQYSAAAARAAKAADAAFKKGDIQAAAVEKRNQLVNSYADRAAHAAQDEVEKALGYFKKFDTEGTRKNLDAEYLDQIDQLLARFDLRSGQSLKAIDRRKSLLEWAESQREQGFEPDIPPELLAEAGRQSYKDMTVEQLRGLRDTVKQIEHLARLKHKLLTAKDQREYEAVRDEIAASIKDHAGERQADTRTPTTNLGRFAQSMRRFFAAHVKAATWARILDGGRDGGPVWEYFVRSANERGDMETSMRAEATTKLSAILDPVFKLGRMGGKGQYFPSINRSLNRESRIAIALNVGNQSNLQRLLGGEGWTLAQVQPVLDSLSKEEWDAVQAIWDHFESYRPLIEAKEKRVYGKAPEWLEPSPVQTPHGEYRGGYYPVKYDPAASQRAEEHADAEGARRQLQGAYTSATTRRSFTKTRAEEVNGRPLLYSLAGLYSGVNDVIHDLSWHEWLIDANRLLRSQSIDAAIRNHYGPEVKAQFKEWAAAIAEGEGGMSGSLEVAVGKLRQNVSVGGIGFNIMSAALQGLGMTQSIVRVGPTHMARGIAQFIASPIDSLHLTNDKSDFMRNRSRTRYRELNELRNRVQAAVPVGDAIKAHAYTLMMRCQQMVDIPTWLGAYDKAIGEGNGEDRAIALADQAVIDAQGGGQTKDLAGIERGGPFVKLFTTFYTFMNTAFNLGVAETMTEASKAKLAAKYLLLYSIPPVLGAVLKEALTPGDAGDDDWKKLAKKLTGEQISYMLGLMVVTREFAEAANIVTGNRARDYAGPSGLRLIGDTLKFGQQAAQGQFDDSFRKAAVNLLGDTLGIPSAQVNRTITGTKALAEGKTHNPAAVAFGFREKH